jgi:hypothetical protein
MPLHAYDVYLNDELIDTVFYSTNEPWIEVKRSLIDHDGYDPMIIVKKVPKGKLHSTYTVRSGFGDSYSDLS